MYVVNANGSYIQRPLLNGAGIMVTRIRGIVAFRCIDYTNMNNSPKPELARKNTSVKARPKAIV